MKKVFSIVLAIILLSSHMSWTMGTHFCGDEAIVTKIMLGETHLDCGMMVMEEPCNDSENSGENGLCLNKVPCCENEYQVFQLTNEFVKDAAQPFFNIEFAVAYVYNALKLNFLQSSTHQFYTVSNPPPLEKDIQVLFQTFLL
ncbi:MAG: hypothetical protein KJ578_03055 [Bacteroidetes bacterium]|nr:hypothetical protein [Bacteroidota bacterium]MBU1578336.1 hypothetical protein [Bacteroidota bacterium]MBU2556741.1 hypothetical protein [Bacteroidota bacterium]